MLLTINPTERGEDSAESADYYQPRLPSAIWKLRRTGTGSFDFGFDSWHTFNVGVVMMGGSLIEGSLVELLVCYFRHYVEYDKFRGYKGRKKQGNETS